MLTAICIIAALALRGLDALARHVALVAPAQSDSD
jgi:hypothetical protein